MSTGTTVFKNGRAQISMNFAGRALCVRIAGIINEDLSFMKLLELIRGQAQAAESLSLDLGQISRINSVGVRGWLLFFEQAVLVLPTVIAAASEAMVEQAGIAPGLFGRADVPILSFSAPFYCETCGTRSSLSVRPQDVPRIGAGRKSPSGTCVECGGALHFDGIENEYFHFLDYKER